MKKFWIVLLTAMLTLGSMQAEARRIGGGKSFGRQSSNVTQRQATPPSNAGNAAQNSQNAARNQQARPQGTNAAQTPRRPWAGILGGLAAGLGLAWLASQLGLGEGLANILTIVLLVAAAVFIWRKLRGNASSAHTASQTPSMAYQGAADTPRTYKSHNVGNDASARPWERSTLGDADTRGSLIGADVAGGSAAAGSQSASALSGPQGWGIPAGFDVEGFLAAAKRNFITLQDAWDKGDISSLRAMMTDEMLAEIKNQLSEREASQPGATNTTEVGMLDAQLLGIEETASDYLASVEFFGMVREDASAGMTPFREVWNMSKPKSGGSGWLVAGVQSMQ